VLVWSYLKLRLKVLRIATSYFLQREHLFPSVQNRAAVRHFFAFLPARRIVVLFTLSEFNVTDAAVQRCLHDFAAAHFQDVRSRSHSSELDL